MKIIHHPSSTLSWVLLALVCGAIAPNVGLLEPGMIYDERSGQ